HPPTPPTYLRSLHDALPISGLGVAEQILGRHRRRGRQQGRATLEQRPSIRREISHLKFSPVEYFACFVCWQFLVLFIRSLVRPRAAGSESPAGILVEQMRRGRTRTQMDLRARHDLVAVAEHRDDVLGADA